MGCHKGSSRHEQTSFNSHRCYSNQRNANEKGTLLTVITSMTSTSNWLSCVTVKFFASIKRLAAKKGWAIRPGKKSVYANPLSRKWNDVLTEVFLQTAARMNAFPTTAMGEEHAITTAAKKPTSLRKDSIIFPSKSFMLREAEKFWWKPTVVLWNIVPSMAKVTSPISFLKGPRWRSRQKVKLSVLIDKIDHN